MDKTFDKIDIIYIILISIYLFALFFGIMWIILSKLENCKKGTNNNDKSNLSTNKIKNITNKKEGTPIKNSKKDTTKKINSVSTNKNKNDYSKKKTTQNKQNKNNSASKSNGYKSPTKKRTTKKKKNNKNNKARKK